MNGRKLGFAVLTAGLVLLVSVLLAEAILRLYATVADTGLADALEAIPSAILIEPHGQVGYRPRPGGEHLYANGTVATINEMGFRGPPVSVPKSIGTFRIVLLGGSTTFGWGVDDAQTIGSQMRRILRERYPEVDTEVVNLAFDGYDSYQLIERMLSDGIPLEPDAVIVNSGVNDVSHARYRDLRDGDPRTLPYRSQMTRLRSEQARGGPSLWTRTKERLYLARLSGWLRRQVMESATRRAASGRPAPGPSWDYLDYFERNLSRLIELAAESGCEVVLLSAPPSSLLTAYAPDTPPQRHYWIHDAVTTQVHRDSLAARARGVAESARSRSAVVYVQHEELPPELFLDDAHLTPKGNERVAQAFVSALDPWLAEWARQSRPIRDDDP